MRSSAVARENDSVWRNAVGGARGYDPLVAGRSPRTGGRERSERESKALQVGIKTSSLSKEGKEWRVESELERKRFTMLWNLSEFWKCFPKAKMNPKIFYFMVLYVVIENGSPLQGTQTGGK